MLRLEKDRRGLTAALPVILVVALVLLLADYAFGLPMLGVGVGYAIRLLLLQRRIDRTRHLK